MEKSLSWCLSVCLYPINVKTLWDLTWPHKVYGQSDFKYVILKYFYLKLFNFVKL